MTDENAPARKHYHSAKEHLAGIKAAQVFHQELAAAHLLRSQAPISEQPVAPEQEKES